MTLEMASQDITISCTYPCIYKVELESVCFNEILQVLCNEVLQGCTHSNLEPTIVSYITSVVEPVGWIAVWRSTKESSGLDLECDFIVEVADVSLLKLEADVVVKSVILPDATDSELNFCRNKFQNSFYTVPLIELYAISEGDEEELYAKTAIAVEYARLFYKNLYRPWDSEDDDLVYSEKVLKPRLQLYFDMKNHNLPKVMISKIKSVLQEGWKKSIELNALFEEMNVCDSDAEINEDDVLKSVGLKTKLGVLQTKMEILENPVIRSFVTKKYVPHKSSKKKLSPVTYIVAKQFTYEMISNLSLDASTILEFERSPESAFKKSSKGDNILIFPGVYNCDSMGWLEENVSVRGIGLPIDIVLKATGNSEVFLNCCGENLEFKNLTLKATPGLTSTVIVHHGKVEFSNCIIDSAGSKTGILLLGGSEASLKDSEVCNAQLDGIQIRPTCSIRLTSCKIISCGNNGIEIEVPDGGMMQTDFVDMSILNCHVMNNEGYAIHIKNAPIQDLCLKKEEEDFFILNLFGWLKHRIENTVMTNNKQPVIGIQSSCEPQKNVSTRFSRKTLHNDSQDGDLNCSMLNDLLDEIDSSDTETSSQSDFVQN